MGSRKIVTPRHCRRDPRAYPAIRDGWGQTRVNKAAERDVGGGLAATAEPPPATASAQGETAVNTVQRIAKRARGARAATG